MDILLFVLQTKSLIPEKLSHPEFTDLKLTEQCVESVQQ